MNAEDSFGFQMLRLDYLSCALTVVSTLLIGRKAWIGFVVAGINSLIISLIGLKTHQMGFIPANVFCIVIYVFSIRAWIRDSRVAATDRTDLKK
ncbi:MAG: hypothetical protein ACRD3S_21115 [Terracidiphilus sp.]